MPLDHSGAILDSGSVAFICAHGTAPTVWAPLSLRSQADTWHSMVGCAQVMDRWGSLMIAAVQ
eukprot:1000106-Pyramimonas_sp.AAC.1